MNEFYHQDPGVYNDAELLKVYEAWAEQSGPEGVRRAGRLYDEILHRFRQCATGEPVAWECDACGMGHSHNKGLDHSLAGAFSKASLIYGPLSKLTYNPDCHCGWHEASVLLQEHAPDDWRTVFVTRRAKQLPLPNSVKAELYDE